MKILIIEDEEDLANSIATGLRYQGYLTEVCNDGEDGLFSLQTNSYDLVILDLNLPTMGGLEILKTIRKENIETAVLILSAQSTVEDKMEGLDLGANDYLTKPFHFGELSARVRSLLRTHFSQPNNELSFGSLQMDIQHHTVLVNKNTLQLTPREYQLLEYLLMNKNSPVSGEKLIEHTGDSQDVLFSNSLKVHISALRKKLSKLDEGITITNIRGAGYLLKEVVL